MKLTLALDLIVPTGKSAKAGVPAEAQDSAILAEFSSLLASEIPVVPAGEVEPLPELPAMPGNALPPETGKNLPLSIAGEVMPKDPETTPLVAPAMPVVASQLHGATPVTTPVEKLPVADQPARIAPAQPVHSPQPEGKPGTVPDPELRPAAQPAEPAASTRQPLNITVTAQQATPHVQAIVPVLPAEVAEPQQSAQANLLSPQAMPKPRSEVAAETPTSDKGDAATGERQQGQPRGIAIAQAPVVASTQQHAPTITEPQQFTAIASPDRAFSPAAASLQRHDFNAVVERLAHAREIAQPAKAEMSIVHREFGHISVQFEMAGHALKVGMASNDAAFAPAVQAALAERPVAAVADAARTDTQAGRQDSQPSSAQNTSSQHGQTSPDGQRHDANSRSAQLRQQSGQQAMRQQADGEGAAAHSSLRHSRDSGLFA